MREITKEQYEKAIELIIEYDKQQYIAESNGRMPIKEFLDKCELAGYSNRFVSGIRIHLDDYDKYPSEFVRPIKYVEDITRRIFMRQISNVGKKSWDEFCKAKMEFNIK